MLLLLFFGLLCSCSEQPAGSIAADGCAAADNKDACYLDLLDCSRIGSKLIRDSCLAELAKTNNDLQACAQITDPLTKGYCQQQIAVALNEAGLCADIADSYWQENCYFHLAVNNNQSSYCAHLADVEMIVGCYQEIAYTYYNHILCANLNEADAQRCYYHIAKETSAPELCGLISTGWGRDSCWAGMAKDLENRSFCQNISLAEIKEHCLSRFA